MSWINLKQIILGVAGTATQKFTLQTPDAPDGTAKLSRGVPGALGQDILGIDASGYMTAQQTPPDTDNSKKIVSTAWAKLGFAMLLAATGYVKLPTWLGGILFQWGYSSSQSWVTFPMTFTVVYTIQCTPYTSTNAGIIWSASVANHSNNSFYCLVRYNNGASVGDAGEGSWWFAIGR